MKKLLFLVLICVFLCACSSDAVPETSVLPASPTPSASVTSEPVAVADEDMGKIIISEVMAKNHTTLLDCNSKFSDWIELQNISDAPISLDGWRLSCDGNEAWIMPDITLDSGDFILVFASGEDIKESELHTDFKLSAGETLSLLTPNGSVSHSLTCSTDDNDVSLAYSDGDFVLCSYPSPGFDNSGSGYDAWQDSRFVEGPLIINEVSVFSAPSNSTSNYEKYDWIELKNISGKSVDLSNYYLSDSRNDYKRCPLPAVTLEAGYTVTFICSKNGPEIRSLLPIELNSESESIFLSTDEGLVDYALLRNIPLEGSFGRLSNENGFFFFDHPTPNKENRSGERRISKKPVSSATDGVYNDIDSISVELLAEGKIYYTLDGSLPNKKSAVYSSPIEVDKTCVVRAVSIEEGALPSKALTLSFIMNENHSLPVVSLVADNKSSYPIGGIFKMGKYVEHPGCISLFEEDGKFTLDCGISITGHQSLNLSKKSMKVKFRSAYENERLNYDVFDTGTALYSSLALRAGQDNHRAVFRQEIWQDLALEATDLVPTQHSKFCIVYINGEYYGIYCLKEDISRQYFADWSGGVSKDSVESVKVPDALTEDFSQTVFRYCKANDMSKDEHYEYICSVLDINSYIDWLILQGISCNVDLFRNIRFFRSAESDGLWKSVLFDLDHAMLDDYGSGFDLGKSLPGKDWPFMSLIGDSAFSSDRMSPLLLNLLKNQQFRAAFLTRYAELYDTVLSNERILERIDYYEALLAPEIARDWKRWRADAEDWEEYVDMLRRCVTELDWQNYVKDSMFRYFKVSDEEINLYFK